MTTGDLQQRTFDFAQRVLKVCLILDQQPGVSRLLSRQLFRSGTSVGANVEEGQASRSRADFVATYSIACREARETHYWLRLLVTSQLLPEHRVHDLLDEANQLIAILTTIVKRSRRKPKGVTSNAPEAPRT
jgi:four helix bundle protein